MISAISNTGVVDGDPKVIVEETGIVIGEIGVVNEETGDVNGKGRTPRYRLHIKWRLNELLARDNTDTPLFFR